MKSFGVISLAMILLASCSGGESATKRDLPRSGSSLDEKKIQCVAQGGFLVPSGNDFSCRLENGQTVGLYQI